MQLYLRLLQFLRLYWGRLVAAAICSGLVAAFTGAYAWLVRPAIDEVFINRNETWLILLPVVLMAVSVLKGVASYGQTYLMVYVGTRVVTDIRQQLFGHLMRLPISFHLKNPSSRMMSRVINDVNWIQNAVSGVLKDLFQQSLTFLVLLGVVFYQNWRLTLLSIVVIPLSVYPMVRFGARLRRLATTGQERTADMSTALQETLTGIRIVKGFTREAAEDRRFARVNEAYFRAWMKSTQVSAFTSPVLETVGVLGVAGIIWYGGWQVMHGTMTSGTFFSFLTAVFLMYNPVKRLASANNSIQQALSAAERVFAVLDVPTEAAQDTGVRDLDGVRSAIELRDVSFRYEGVETWALQDISLTVKAGEVLALVGSSGAGKTTLVNLIPRFYDPTKGAILIDGVDLREIRLAALRRQIGIVSQETLLFDDTVRHNIAYGRDDVTDDAIIEAARAAYAHDFIMRMPNGYDTLIGENGVKLSGGERQRLAIARALLRNPPILILDEATSSLDTESERMVQMALANLMKGRTTFVIAHRLSTVQRASRIVVLAGGRIVEIGRHEDLLAGAGTYQRLYQMQFQNGGEDMPT
ncbi:MAG TPA: lipid A export permease/ATP-binding protein MsbA [Nitrospirales bacterium]|jgi:subfamily B ATP-binding cassette protein MsbA|nr:lipid A export permease/ATP-binding protein MsbA [Nitrospirales bacterium]